MKKTPVALMFSFQNPSNAMKCAERKIGAGETPRRVRRHLACRFWAICHDVTTMAQAKEMASRIVDGDILHTRLVRDDTFQDDLATVLEQLDAANDIRALSSKRSGEMTQKLTEVDAEVIVGEVFMEELRAA